MISNILDFALGLVGFGADIVTVTSGTVGVSGNVAADLQTYFAANLLEVAEYNTILDQFGDRVNIPSNSSKTVHFTRMEKFAVQANPSQLIESIAPDAVGITMSQFEATAEQYGFLVRISDLAELTAKHPVVQRAMYMLSIQAAETYDQLIYNVINQGTSVYYPNGKVSDAGLVAGDTVGYSDLVALDALMNDAGARPMDGGDYVLITPSQVYAGLLKDPDYKAAHQLVSPDHIYRGEVDMLAGFRVVRSNAPAFAATTQATVGAANKVYSSFAIAKNAYQISDLQNLKVYVVAPGGQSDPLQQNRKLGWKFAFKTIITNQNWIFRLRSAGASSVNN